MAKRATPRKGKRGHLHPEPFFLVVIDRDKEVFNVIGPVEDDSPYVREVNQALNKGRNVVLHNPGEFGSREDVIRNVERTLGYRYTDKAVVELRGA